jgi:hypothetical protein
VGGAGLHNKPSDLDLFFLLALSEYIAATGDVDFLKEEAPFYPEDGWPVVGSVLEHARVAFDHLTEKVGLGENNLIRLSDGDWSDAVLLDNVLRFWKLVSFDETVERGESIPNSQMALYVLPRFTRLLAGLEWQEAKDAAQAMQAKLDTLLPALETALAAQWTSQHWYARAVMRSRWRNRQVVIDSKTINLKRRCGRSSPGWETRRRGEHRRSARRRFAHRRAVEETGDHLAGYLATADMGLHAHAPRSGVALAVTQYVRRPCRDIPEHLVRSVVGAGRDQRRRCPQLPRWDVGQPGDTHDRFSSDEQQSPRDVTGGAAARVRRRANGERGRPAHRPADTGSLRPRSAIAQAGCRAGADRGEYRAFVKGERSSYRRGG